MLSGLLPNIGGLPMSSIPMTTLLGVAAVVGPLTLAVLAQSEDRALATKQCVGENCVTANSGKTTGKKLLKTQQNKKTGSAQKIADAKNKSVQGMMSVQPSRISCGDGRNRVAKRFNRVRTLECKGGTYAYLGRRNGATFKILVDRRTGRVIGRAPI
jgi:hypothetical protein